MAETIYIAAHRATLLELLDAVVRELRETTAGSVSVPIYSSTDAGATIYLTDEDTESWEEGIVNVEVE